MKKSSFLVVLVFLSSGRNSETPFNRSPYFIKCLRTKNDIDSIDDFVDIHEDKYFSLSESVSIGTKDNTILSDVSVSLDSIQILFEPIPGEELGFFAADSDIPTTTTFYDKDKKQFDIEMKTIHLNINNNKIQDRIMTGSNRYIGNSGVKRNEENIKLIFMVEDEPIKYISTIKKIPGGLPFLEIRFTSYYIKGDFFESSFLYSIKILISYYTKKNVREEIPCIVEVSDNE